MTDIVIDVVSRTEYALDLVGEAVEGIEVVWPPRVFDWSEVRPQDEPHEEVVPHVEVHELDRAYAGRYAEYGVGSAADPRGDVPDGDGEDVQPGAPSPPRDHGARPALATA